MTPIEHKIDQVVDGILDDYRLGRDIDKLEQFCRPDKDVVISIIEKLRRIMFPGYFRDKSYKLYSQLSCSWIH